MKLYIANTTKQDHDFVYRVPEIDRMFHQPVPSGQQVLVYKEMSTSDVDAIIKQHAQYGLTRVDEIDRRKPFIGMCYSIDKQIPVSKIMYAAEHNDDVLAEQGLEGRKEAAAALSDKLNRESGGSLVDLEVQVIEDKKKGDTTKRFDSTIQVTGNPDKPRRGGRPRKAA